VSSPSLVDLGIAEIAAGYRNRSWSPLDVTRASLARIEATDSHLHAWVMVDGELALAAAEEATQELAAGIDRGPLHGVPFGVKDIFDVAGMPTRCGSAARTDAPRAPADAVSVRLMREAGAIVLGKTTTQEFAAGVISAPARNPWDTDRSPGGSSGGSAAAVAVGACLGALGSDTGGSIRIPAAACGVTGFKPAFGALSTAGVYPLSWSLDTVGPLARTVSDTQLLWNALAGQTRPLEEGAVLDGSSTHRTWRVGVPRDFFLTALQPGVVAAVEHAVAALRAQGVTIVECGWPEAAAARACAFIINRAETAAVHESLALNDPDRFQLLGPELRLRIAAGRSLPTATYLRALRAREAIRDSMCALFRQHEINAMLVPTLPTVAVLAESPLIEDTGRDESVGAGHTRLTMPFNATGQPVLSLPVGFDERGLPIGVQLAGLAGDEVTLFQLGALLEFALDVTSRRPTLLRLEEAQ
jgi:aspartyl-tRNA(Asn)/glutamyl-tRNA(Gln) amidotransferase subunit A